MNTATASYEPNLILNKDFCDLASDDELRHILEYLPDIYKDMVKELATDKE